MIQVTKRDGTLIYLAAAAVATVEPAGPSGRWHGIMSYIRTFDGRTFEVTDDAGVIASKLDAASV